ncbi:MAG: hypothetical protein NC432_15905 [Roseburia sp.]|nr:hypothetical protein [Roseburia sp.]MCM1099690.1 hypothetical protein [Ruminococcus flavefaciens]
MAERQERSVDGYLFYTEKDAKIAAAERKKIEYLEARMDYGEPESILLIYEKTIHERVFRTPIGMQYLKGMRDFLLSQPEIDPERVPDIPLYNTFSGEVREQDQPARSRIKPATKRADREKSRFIISVALNILLILAVISMFGIALKSDQPNILNYEKVITDRYASWDQELTEREQIIRERERELKLERN